MAPPLHAGLFAPRIFAARFAMACGEILPNAWFGWASRARPLTLPLHWREHFGASTVSRAQARLRSKVTPHSEQISVNQQLGSRPRVCPFLAALTIRPAHAREQVLLLTTCSFVRHGNTVEQCLQVFHHGYARFALPCKIPSEREAVSSISFNDAAMLSGDKLLCSISVNTEGETLEVEHGLIGNGPPLEAAGLHVEAECATAYDGFIIS